MKTNNQYPDWVEKYRTKGCTIRKVRDGYGLYKCTSEYVPGAKYPKSKQTYLGMVTQKDGFIPKKSTSSHPSYIEYGLSHLIWCSFRRELCRSSFNGDDIFVRLAIIKYIFGSIRDDVIGATFLSDGLEQELRQRAASSSGARVGRLAAKVGSLLSEKIRDPEDRAVLEALLRSCVMDSSNRRAQVPALPGPAAQIIERYGLKYGQG